MVINYFDSSCHELFCKLYSVIWCSQAPMQGLSQTFREGFSMGGMSQVLYSSGSDTIFFLCIYFNL